MLYVHTNMHMPSAMTGDGTVVWQRGLWGRCRGGVVVGKRCRVGVVVGKRWLWGRVGCVASVYGEEM